MKKINYKAHAKKALTAFKKRNQLPKVVKAKKRNPNDATMRNIKALKKRVTRLEIAVNSLLIGREIADAIERDVKKW